MRGLSPKAEFTIVFVAESQWAPGSCAMRASMPCFVGPTMFPGSSCRRSPGSTMNGSHSEIHSRYHEPPVYGLMPSSLSSGGKSTGKKIPGAMAWWGFPTLRVICTPTSTGALIARHVGIVLARIALAVPVGVVVPVGNHPRLDALRTADVERLGGRDRRHVRRRRTGAYHPDEVRPERVTGGDGAMRADAAHVGLGETSRPPR